MRLSALAVAFSVAVGVAACSDGRSSDLVDGSDGTDGASRRDLAGSLDPHADLGGAQADLAPPPADLAPPSDLAPYLSFGSLSASLFSYTNGAQTVHQSSVSASFVHHVTAPPPSTCTTTTSGGCTVWVCPLGGPASPTPVSESAGTVTVAGATTPISFSPAANNSYSPFVDTTQLLWSGGTTLTFSTAGATVPAFQLSAVAPSLLTLTSPATTAGKLPLDRAQDLAFVWSGGASGEAVVSLSGVTASSSVLINCNAAASAGRLTVPKALLAMLPSPHTGASWGFSTSARADRVVGSYQIYLFVSSYGPGSDGYAAIGSLSY